MDETTQGASMHKLFGDIAATLAGLSTLANILPTMLSLGVLACTLVWWGFRFFEKFTGKVIGKKPC